MHEQDREQRRAGLIDTMMTGIEQNPALDRLAKPVGMAADMVGTGRVAAALRGEQLGHALHPLFTDLPIGFWTSAAALDLMGGRSARIAARRLVALGVLTAPAAALTGLADWSVERRRSTTRVGALHAVLNSTATTLYLLSWWSRRRSNGRHGKAFGMAGLVVASVSGMLGGHMAFGLGAGVGHRGQSSVSRSAEDVSGSI